MGVGRDSPARVGAGIRHVLQASRDEGHCFLTEDQILKNCRELLDINNDCLIQRVLRQLLEANEIKNRVLTSGEGAATECYYSNSLYFDEAYVSKRIAQFVEIRIQVDASRVSEWIEKYCKRYEMNLSHEQRVSVEGIARSSFSILTGGPGCGKTTSTKVLFRLLQAMRKIVVLAAPTGRAAQRMSEVIGSEAKTIYRSLEWSPKEAGFKRNEEDPLKAEFLIVDECSMLDISLAAALLKAVPLTCQVLFIGDPDQLPSVGAGNVLQDLLSSKCVAHFRLTQVFRQAEQSLIIQCAHQINRGEIPRIASPLANPSLWKEKVDCLFIDAEEASQEQLRFLRRAKQAISTTINADVPHLLKTGEQVWGQMIKADGNVEIDELYVPPVEDDELRQPVLFIPDKFRHIDLEGLSRSSTDIEELRHVLLKIHPWSSLHYGLTALDTVVRLYTKTIPEFYGKSCETQILTPQVRGTLGSLGLNQQIQQAVNPEKPGTQQITIGEKIFREGDRVIQTRNNYDLGVFNGDIGRIQAIDSEDYSCRIQFGSSGQVVTYPKEDLTELALAYAVTIHKSQGTEFETVIIPVTAQHFKMLFRNLIYTAVTRAKKLAVFVGSRKALAMAVRRIDSRKRQTALSQLVSQHL